MKYILILLSFTLIALPASAFTTGDLRAGLNYGKVGLLQDVGQRSGSSNGFGGHFSYANSSELMLEIGYLKSNHTELRHTEIPIGFNYYFAEWKITKFFLSFGICYITNVLTHDTVDLTSSGYGAYAGGGVDVYALPFLVAGFQARYVKGYEQTVQLSNGDRAAALQDNFTVMLRLAYELNFQK